MENQKQPTCEARIDAHLKSRLSDLRLLFRGAELSDVALVDDGTLDTVLRVGNYEHRLPDTADYRDEETGELDLVSLFEAERDSINEALRESLYDYGLAFDYVAPGTFDCQAEGYFRYQLSYGGPSDEFRFFVNPDFSCHRIEYWFLDWFDGASRRLHGGELALMLGVFEFFLAAGSVDSAYKQATE